jgi:hypothetical protein
MTFPSACSLIAFQHQLNSLQAISRGAFQPACCQGRLCLPAACLEQGFFATGQTVIDRWRGVDCWIGGHGHGDPLGQSRADQASECRNRQANEVEIDWVLFQGTSGACWVACVVFEPTGFDIWLVRQAVSKRCMAIANGLHGCLFGAFVDLG